VSRVKRAGIWRFVFCSSDLVAMRISGFVGGSVRCSERFSADVLYVLFCFGVCLCSLILGSGFCAGCFLHRRCVWICLVHLATRFERQGFIIDLEGHDDRTRAS
jgi:hypothetical protein